MNLNTPSPNPSAFSAQPEFFPIPQRGVDPFFGLGRSSYYALERQGLLRLVRVRRPGQIRGKLLVPFADTASLLRKLQEKQGAV